ncbi:sensor domain-containing protein [Streptomyces sp. NPDC048639]|uniref:sensor domain-containing protein n=1 Tax=Streptomyces sp. NPDC048639 TaxID=3365581 RepID=UPI00371B1B61
MPSGIQRVLTCALLSALSVTLTACGPSDQADDDEPGRPRSGQRPLTSQQLEDALPKGGDLPGFHGDPYDLPLFDHDDVVTTDSPKCRPIAETMNFRPRYERRGLAWAALEPDAASEEVDGSISLSSHTVADAKAWMADLHKALDECTGFTATSKRGWTFAFTVGRLPTVKAGHGSVSYTLANTSSPDGHAGVMTVVRTWGTLTSYLMSQDPDDPNPVSAAVARRQDERLRAIATRPLTPR